MRLVVIAVVLLAARAAAAGPADKEPSTATGIAIGSWLGSLAVVAVGVAVVESNDGIDDDTAGYGVLVAGLGLAVVSPSSGHIYAGEHRHAAVTSGLRAGGLLLAGYGYRQFWAEGDGSAAIGIGAVVVVTATIYDLVDAPRAARRANRRAAVVPVVAAKDGATPGLSLVGAF